MKIFLDTANLDEIRTAARWGIVDGVTTNPSLIAKEGSSFKEIILEICSYIDGPISAETTKLDAEGMIEEGREFAQWHANIHVKIPATIEGIKAAKVLSSEGIKTNVTLVFSLNQVLLAAKAGATFISPFVGRLDDVGEDGATLISDAVQVIERYRFSSDILVASVRSPNMVARAALCGAHIATIPFKVLESMYQHPLTDAGLKKFLADWQSMPKNQ